MALNSALAACMLAKPCSSHARCSLGHGLGDPVEEVVDGVAGLAIVPVAQADDAAGAEFLYTKATGPCSLAPERSPLPPFLVRPLSRSSGLSGPLPFSR
jgi:hypothetical protein